MQPWTSRLYFTHRTRDCRRSDCRREQYHEFLHELHDTGLRIDCSDASFARLSELRKMYEPYITALSKYFEFVLPPIIVDEVPVDNWQRSPWQKKLAGHWPLPSIRPEDHFV